jgi:hypothetical protein
MAESEGPINPKTAYEPADASPALLLGLLALVAAVTIAAALILSGIFPSTLNERSAAPTRLPPQPRPQINEFEAMSRFNARVEKRLDGYGWVDRRHGIVRVPIDEAIKRAAKNGFPDWPGNPPGAVKQAAKTGAPGKPK